MPNLDRSGTTTVVLAALCAAWPAFYYVLADIFMLPNPDVFTWFAIGLPLVMCVFTGISCAAAWPQASWTPVAAVAVAASHHFCRWLAPALWLFLATSVATFVVNAIWPQVPQGSIWLTGPLALGLAFGLSYLPSRRVSNICLVVAGVALAVLTYVVAVALVAIYFKTASKPDDAGRDFTPSRAQVPYQVVKDDWDEKARDTASSSPPETSDNGTGITVATGSSPAEFSFQGSQAASAPPPFAARYAMAIALAAMLMLAVWSFLAALSSGATFKRPGLQFLMVLILIAVQCGLFCAIHASCHGNFGLYSPAAANPPMSDELVLIGTWAFGSYRAGQCLMLAQLGLMFLVLIAAAAACLGLQSEADESLPPLSVSGDSSRAAQGLGAACSAKRPRRVRVLRASIASALCILMIEQTFAGPATGTLAAADGSAAVPSLFTVVLYGVSLAVPILCTMACVAALRALRARPNTKFLLAAPVIGLATGVTCIAAQIACPTVVGWKSDREFLYAVAFFAVWVGAFITGGTRRRYRT